MIKEDRGSFCDLLAELIEAFYKNRCVYFPFDNARIPVVVLMQKTSEVEATAMRRGGKGND